MLYFPKQPIMERLEGTFCVELVQKLLTFFFANDCLLFCWANSSEFGKILQIFSWYEAVSGQNVNTKKTIAFFSRNTLK